MPFCLPRRLIHFLIVPGPCFIGPLPAVWLAALFVVGVGSAWWPCPGVQVPGTRTAGGLTACHPVSETCDSALPCPRAPSKASPVTSSFFNDPAGAQPSPIHQQDAQAPVTEQPVSLCRALQPFSFFFFSSSTCSWMLWTWQRASRQVENWDGLAWTSQPSAPSRKSSTLTRSLTQAQIASRLPSGWKDPGETRCQLCPGAH
jgi:hypothetical protein